MKKPVIDDNLSLTINLRWLAQLIVLLGMALYGWWQLESRIQNLERNMATAMQEIEFHAKERKASEQKHINDMEERMLWYEKELNLNPFSWGKKK